jgi:hypothetical protein
MSVMVEQRKAATTSSSEPQSPRNRDQEIPRRKGERIDDERDKAPEPDTIPDTPPTEPDRPPMKEPPPPEENQGPLIASVEASRIAAPHGDARSTHH